LWQYLLDISVEEILMIKTFGAAALLIAALAAPVNDASAQDALGGALLGGAAGAILGGALGGGRGAAIGAIIGGTTGAIIGAEGERRANGYYYYNTGCYEPRGDGSYVAVHPSYCGPAAVPPPRAVRDDAVEYCMQRYRSYDPRSGTYMGHDGIRRPCP
jgi:BA14K-like protein/Glycine zipper